jgi:HD superfamily phosphohydrolase
MSSSDLLGFLASDFTEAVRDPLWGNVFLSPGLEAIASSPPFAKLGRIKQLGPAFLVYPGATHTRRAHSIGVFHMAKRIVSSLAAKGELDFCTRMSISSYLVAALCHDLGHFPFAHSLKELPLAAHETLASRDILDGELRGLVEAAGADPELVAAIIDEDRLCAPYTGGRELGFFRGLLSGVLDPDKLDYLNRDAFFCGVPYGLQDSDFILQRLSIGPGGVLAIEERGLMSVEDLLFSKYLMYRSVYWHRGVRSATAMIKKAVLLALSEGVLASEDLYGLDDDGFYSLLRSRARTRGFKPLELADKVFDAKLFCCVLDLPVDLSDERQNALLDLMNRLQFEGKLASEAGMGSLDLVIDLPESISFETDLCVLGDGSASSLSSRARSFAESPTVFSPPVVAGFASALRRLRVFASSPSERLSSVLRREFG